MHSMVTDYSGVLTGGEARSSSSVPARARVGKTIKVVRRRLDLVGGHRPYLQRCAVNPDRRSSRPRPAAPRQVNGTRGIRNGAARGQRAGKTLGGGLWVGRTRQAYGQ